MIRRLRGQEAIEFILIAVLVFFAALFVMITLGNNLAAFFKTDSSVAKSANKDVNLISLTDPVKYTPDFETHAENDPLQTSSPALSDISYDNIDISNYNTIINSDGSITVDIDGQAITLPKEVIALQDTALQTTGSSGANSLIKEIAYMIETYKSEYPAGVPVELAFGVGDRRSNDAVFNGTAEVNTVAIKVGDKVVIIQKDQKCSWASSGVPQGGCCATHENATGTYRIEGNVAADGTFTGDVTSESSSSVTGKYSGKLNTSNGFVFEDTSFKADPIANYGSYSTNFTWDIKFDQSTKKFSL